MNDSAQLAKEIVTAFLANPKNKAVKFDDIPGMIAKIGASLDQVSVGSGRQPVAPTPVVEDATLAPVEASTIRLTAAPRAARRAAEKVWPNVPKAVTDKFEDLINREGIPRDARGRPICAKVHDRLITPDKMKVLDPISGVYYSMLKHHFRASYGLTHQEVCAMYHLTYEQLPETAPNYSTTKSLAAKSMGLGKRRPTVA